MYIGTGADSIYLPNRQSRLPVQAGGRNVRLVEQKSRSSGPRCNASIHGIDAEGLTACIAPLGLFPLFQPGCITLQVPETWPSASQRYQRNTTPFEFRKNASLHVTYGDKYTDHWTAQCAMSQRGLPNHLLSEAGAASASNPSCSQFSSCTGAATRIRIPIRIRILPAHNKLPRASKNSMYQHPRAVSLVQQSAVRVHRSTYSVLHRHAIIRSNTP